MNYFCLFLAALSFSFLEARFQEPKALVGSIETEMSESLLTIRASSDFTVLEWEDFSLEEMKGVEFILPSEKAALLNSVVGSKESFIAGKVVSNGQLFWVNPNGFQIEMGGEVDAAHLLFSTLEGEKGDFSHYMNSTWIGDRKKKISNRGLLQAQVQDIFLISPCIKNEGVCLSENGGVHMAASNQIIFSENGVEILGEEGEIENLGRIETSLAKLQASGGSSSDFAISQKGIIQVKGEKALLSAHQGNVEVQGVITASDSSFKRGGEILILGNSLFLRKGSEIDASGDWSGGRISIGFDAESAEKKGSFPSFLFVEEGAILRADARENGNGGTILFFAEKENLFLGTASVQGGRMGGDGGMIEMTSQGETRFLGKVSLLAPFGKKGVFLLAP